MYARALRRIGGELRGHALGILMRRGYAPELALDALRRHCGAEPEPDF